MLPATGGSTSTSTAPKKKKSTSTSTGGYNPPPKTSSSSGGGGGGYVPPPKPSYQPSYVPSGGPGRAVSVSAPPRPKPPSVGQFLKRDVGYRQTLRELALNWSNFMADKSRQTGAARTQYGQQRSALGTQRTRDLSDINADFASRGLLHSGLLATRLSEYQKDYLANMASYQSQYDDFLRQLAASQSQLSSSQRLEREKSKQEALARRASKYGL